MLPIEDSKHIARRLGTLAETLRIPAAIRREKKNGLAEAYNRLKLENDKLRDIHFITLEYANMIENDLIDRIKSLNRTAAGDKGGAGPGSLADEVLSAENHRLKMEVEKLSVILSTVVSHDTIVEDQLVLRLKETNDLAIRDPLTQIFNRRKFNEELVRAYGAMSKTGCALSLIMFDIDHFKSINDSFGHEAGDEVLKSISAAVGPGLPDRAVFARWGGEEFMILVPDARIGEATSIAEALRVAIRDLRPAAVGRVTCSFGVIEVGKEEPPQSILRRLDALLYEAKECGRDCVRSGACLQKKREAM